MSYLQDRQNESRVYSLQLGTWALFVLPVPPQYEGAYATTT
jgi:hypothetical protein